MARNNYYLIKTGATPMPNPDGQMAGFMEFYDLSLSEEYKERLNKKPGELGFIPGTTIPVMAENFHTAEMLAEGFIDQTDEDGSILIEKENKEFAKKVLRSLHWRSGVLSSDPASVKKKKYMDLYASALDKFSPRDILTEMEKELDGRYTPTTSRTPLEKRKAEKLETKKSDRDTPKAQLK